MAGMSSELSSALNRVTTGYVDPNSAASHGYSFVASQIHRGIDETLAVIIMSVCGLSSSMYGTLRRALFVVLRVNGGAATFGGLQQYAVKLPIPPPVPELAPIMGTKDQQEFADVQVRFRMESVVICCSDCTHVRMSF